MNEKLIDRIFIRARTDGTGDWATFSLKELLDMGKQHVVLAWLVARLIDAQEHEQITDEVAETIAGLLPKELYHTRREEVPDRRTLEREGDLRRG